MTDKEELRHIRRMRNPAYASGYHIGFADGYKQAEDREEHHRNMAYERTITILQQRCEYLLKMLNKEITNMKVLLDEGAFAPNRAHETDAGADLMSPIDIMVKAHDSAVIDTGVHVELPDGYVGMLKSKSGLNVKNGLVSEGVIDVGYTGSIRVKLYNHSDSDYNIHRGDKITQIVILPCIFPSVELVDKLEDTERGDSGFGSTGR